MRTKRFLGSAIAMLCMLAIIGSGFAIWVFQYKSTASQDVTGITVYQAVNVGAITTADAFTVNFDQATRNDNWNLVAKGAGITINFAENANKVASYSTSDTVYDKTTLQVKFTVVITVTNGLADYIDISYDGTALAKSTDKATNVGTFTFTSTSANEFDWAKVTISYSNEPTTYADYTTFASAVTDGSISVAYTAEVVGK